MLVETDEDPEVMPMRKGAPDVADDRKK